MRRLLAFALSSLALSACSNADAAPEAASSTMASADAAQTTAAPVELQELPTALVYKTPTCGCCNGWVEHLEAAGFTVETRDVAGPDLVMLKRDGGVPGNMTSCHTALIDGYVVEGHVPADQIKRLLAERPDVAGIAVPGMPIGSPGMEGAGAQPYQVLSFSRTGEAAPFATVDPR